MTSVSRELGAERDLAAFTANVRERFGEVFGRELVEVEPPTEVGAS